MSSLRWPKSEHKSRPRRAGGGGGEGVEREQTTIQIGLRVPESVNAQLEDRASSIGVSKNSLILMLIRMGFKVLDADVTLLHQQE